VGEEWRRAVLLVVVATGVAFVAGSAVATAVGV